MMIDLGEPEVLERHVSKLLERGIHRRSSLANLL
jgi:hypothetical protein